MSSFYVLKVGGFTQYKYAWYETGQNARYADTCPTCPACGGAVGSLYWLPPRRVALKQPRRVGDLVYGAGGSDLIVSDRFRMAFEQERLTGIVASHPVDVTQMGTTRKSKQYAAPVLLAIDIQHGPARVLHEQMGVVWDSPPQPDYCRTCGPGGGGKGGVLRSYERIVVDSSSWKSEDFFFALNFSGVILLSERAREFMERHQFTNATITPCEQYCYSFGPGWHSAARER